MPSRKPCKSRLEATNFGHLQEECRGKLPQCPNRCSPYSLPTAAIRALALSTALLKGLGRHLRIRLRTPPTRLRRGISALALSNRMAENRKSPLPPGVEDAPTYRPLGFGLLNGALLSVHATSLARGVGDEAFKRNAFTGSSHPRRCPLPSRPSGAARAGVGPPQHPFPRLRRGLSRPSCSRCARLYLPQSPSLKSFRLCCVRCVSLCPPRPPCPPSSR